LGAAFTGSGFFSSFFSGAAFVTFFSEAFFSTALAAAGAAAAAPSPRVLPLAAALIASIQSFWSASVVTPRTRLAGLEISIKKNFLVFLPALASAPSSLIAFAFLSDLSSFL